MPKSKGGGKSIPKVKVEKHLPKDQEEQFINALKKRFKENTKRHKNLDWDKLENKLRKHPVKLLSLYNMENTGGEPDVIGYDKENKEYTFCDCSKESPEGRRSICYDTAGEEERKKKGIHPGGNAVNLAKEMGIELLDKMQYRNLQELGEFDTKTSSWLKTPDTIRQLGGAIFGDRRYDTVFVYHNGAQSFYSARGFRGILTL